MTAISRYSDWTSIKGIKPSKIWPIVALLAVMGTLTACTLVGPDYEAPPIDAPDAWHTELHEGLQPEPADPKTLAEWWTTLNDPVLSKLISQVVEKNLDLEQAKSRVREARARRGISNSELFPSIDGMGSIVRSQQNENAGNYTGDINSLYKAGFDAGWEIDIFGGLRRAVEAAEAELQASDENLRDVLVSLLAETALNYIELRAYQARIDVAESNINALEETLDLIQSRHKAGLSNELSLLQACYNLESARSQVPVLRSGLDATANRLAVLAGQNPGELHELLAAPRPIPVTPPAVAVGVPAEALRRRPDIRRAERELAAQTARVGVAVSDLYPRFRLVGSIGLESLETSDFFSSSSQLWSFGPGVTWNIFNAGAVRNNITVQSELQEQYVLAYEAAVLGALEEVENSLTTYAEEHVRREQLSNAVDSAQRAKLLAEDRYKAGLVDFINVLNAQRSLLSFQDQLVQSNSAATSNLIKIYKALGGGWNAIQSLRSENITRHPHK